MSFMRRDKVILCGICLSWDEIKAFPNSHSFSKCLVAFGWGIVISCLVLPEFLFPPPPCNCISAFACWSHKGGDVPIVFVTWTIFWEGSLLSFIWWTRIWCRKGEKIWCLDDTTAQYVHYSVPTKLKIQGTKLEVNPDNIDLTYFSPFF
jgi:hypothetical protein